MWFKNLLTYRLPANWAMTAEKLAECLAPQAFTPCTSSELQRQGWASPRGNGQLVHAVNRQMLLCLQTEKKLLPASVINQVAKAKAVELEEAQGFAPGRKAMKELKERVADELLPRAFGILARTYAWIDPVNGWLVVDAASASKADDVVKMLLRAVDRMPLESLRVARSPVAMMTAWLEMDEAPAGFTVDQDAIMQAAGESKASVRYVKHTLEVDDLRRHIAAGKQCKRLAMTWSDKISFVLDQTLTIKSIKPLDVIKENDASVRNDEERFDNDMMLMTGELAQMLADIMEALGGECGDLVSPAPVKPQASVERAIKLTAKLYQTRDDAKAILGVGYADRMEHLGSMIKDEMRASKSGVVEAATAICNRQATTSNNLFILAAAVEMTEPSTAPAAHDPMNGDDPLYDQAVSIVKTNQRASISLVQRHLRIGYNRAARLLEGMEAKGVLGSMQSNGNREILQAGGDLA